MKYFLFFALLLSMTALSCGPDALFDEEKEIPGAAWAYKDTLDFSFTVTDTTTLYNIYVDFAYADTFPNQNIYVKFYTLFPGGKRLSKPLSFDFFDALGNPSGECSGGKCEARIPIQQNAYFNQAGQYTITLEQFGRRDPVSGVYAVGLSIERTAKKK